MPHSSAKLTDVQAVIFNWSGVISDDRKPIYETNTSVLKKFGHTIEDFSNWLLHSTSSAPSYFARYGITEKSDILMQEHAQALAQARRNGTHPIPYPDAAHVLAALKKLNKTLYVVSGHPKNHLYDEMKEYKLERYFSKILPEVMDKGSALQELRSAPALYIGDTIYDIQAARRAGMIAAGITTGYHSREQLMGERPDLLVDSLTQLLHHFSHKYVGMDNPFMQAAKEYAKAHSLDRVMPTASIIIKDGKIIGKGANGSDYHKTQECERVKRGIPTGQGYELCEGCHPKNHSEPRAIANAIRNTNNETRNTDLYLWGHWWCCEPCWNAMIAAGIRDVYLLENSEILFNKNHPDNIVGRQLRRE